MRRQRGTGKESTQPPPGRVEGRLEFMRTIQDAGSRVKPFLELREREEESQPSLGGDPGSRPRERTQCLRREALRH